jgi:pimeloyl-ACP methyl ester carboxylesterase
VQTDQYTDADKWAEDIAAIIDELALDRVILVGWSYGGYIISDYVRRKGQSKIAGINFVNSDHADHNSTICSSVNFCRRKERHAKKSTACPIAAASSLRFEPWSGQAKREPRSTRRETDLAQSEKRKLFPQPIGLPLQAGARDGRRLPSHSTRPGLPQSPAARLAMRGRGCSAPPFE